MDTSDVNGTNPDIDFKEDDQDQEKSGENENTKYDAKTLAYMENLLKEKHVLDTAVYPIAARLLEEELAKTKQTGQGSRDYRYVDIFRERPVKVVVKVMVPVNEYPKFNFVGKLLGPKGNTLRRLQEETMCKMTVLGRGSMKDKLKEEELRQGLDPKYSHLSDDLHVEVSTLAPPSEAHGRISYALKQLRRYLIPDANDDISQEQLRELESYGDGEEDINAKSRNQANYKGKRAGPAPPAATRTKVFSILEKARNALQSSKAYPPGPMPPHPPNNFGRNGPRAYDEYAEDYEPQRFEEPSRRQWNRGYKMTTGPSRFVPTRLAPY